MELRSIASCFQMCSSGGGGGGGIFLRSHSYEFGGGGGGEGEMAVVFNVVVVFFIHFGSAVGVFMNMCTSACR